MFTILDVSSIPLSPSSLFLFRPCLIWSRVRLMRSVLAPLDTRGPILLQLQGLVCREDFFPFPFKILTPR